MQRLVFDMIITDPEHGRLRLKWLDYHGIIAQLTPINPTVQSAVGLFWFLTSSCFRLIGVYYSTPTFYSILVITKCIYWRNNFKIPSPLCLQTLSVLHHLTGCWVHAFYMMLSFTLLEMIWGVRTPKAVRHQHIYITSPAIKNDRFSLFHSLTYL